MDPRPYIFDTLALDAKRRVGWESGKAMEGSVACVEDGVMRNINMWTMSQHAHEDGCKPHNSCLYWSYITLDGSKLTKTWMRDQRVQQFFLLFIGGCIPNLHDKPGKVTPTPQQLICRFYSLFQKACRQGTKAKAIPKKTVLEMRGNCQYELFTIVHTYCIHCIKIITVPTWLGHLSISAVTTYAWTHSGVQQTVHAIKVIARNLIKVTLIIMIQGVEMKCCYLVMSISYIYSQLSDWTRSRTIIIMSISNTNKLEVTVAHGQREADHGYIVGDLFANIKGFVWKLLVFCLWHWWR